MYRSEMLRRELTLLAQRNGLEGTVRIGEHVVNLDVEQVRRKPRRVGLTLLSGSKRAPGMTLLAFFWHEGGRK